MKPRLTIIRGLPGSGKSTLARSFECLHVEADMFFRRGGEYKFDASEIKDAHAWCFGVVSDAIGRGFDAVVSNTFTRVWEMEPYLGLDADITVMRCSGDYGTTHGVPEDVIARMRSRFEDYSGEVIVW